MTVERWRLIDSGYLPGHLNMAIDMALAKFASSANSFPTVRFYGWNPDAISLGFHQSSKEIDTELCEKDGVDVVIRPTGGRAILHAEELTYAVSLPANSRYYDKDIIMVYERLSRCLVSGLKHLNIPAAFERADKTPKNFSRGELSSLCYASSIQHEIGYNGKKLVGSAQRRFEGAALQHGSILIGRRHLDLPNYLAEKTVERKKAIRRYMEANTICLNDLSIHHISYSELAEAIRHGFEEELDIEFFVDELSGDEVAKAEELKESFSAFRAIGVK